MDNKPSELSKPVAWVLHTRGGDVPTMDECYVANAEGMENIRSSPLYSQEYVSALLAELGASSLQCRGIEQERELFRLERTAHQLHAQALEQRIAELESLILVPGALRCAKCQFQLTKTIICMKSGTTGAGDSKTEPCPNGCGPLWPVTWKQWAKEMDEQAGRYFDELKAAEAKLAMPVRLKKADSSSAPITRHSFNAAVNYCAKAVRAAGFKCVGDE